MTFLFRVDLVLIQLLVFPYLKFIISHSIVNDNLAGFSNLGYVFLFQNFECIMPLPSGPQFLQRNQQITLWGFPCIQLLFSLLLPLELCLFCYFDSVMSWYGSSSSFLGLSVIPVPGYLFPSWFGGVFSHNFLKYIFDSFFSLLWDPYNVSVGMLNVIPESSCFHLKKNFFFPKIFWLGDFRCFFPGHLSFCVNLLLISSVFISAVWILHCWSSIYFLVLC